MSFLVQSNQAGFRIWPLVIKAFRKSAVCILVVVASLLEFHFSGLRKHSLIILAVGEKPWQLVALPSLTT